MYSAQGVNPLLPCCCSGINRNKVKKTGVIFSIIPYRVYLLISLLHTFIYPSMNIDPGSFLISTPALDDPNFKRAVIFICEHNEKGSMGFVINKLFSRKFNELVEFNQSIAFPLFAGGPVKKENVFFLHRRPDLIKDGIPVAASVYLGGNFDQAVAYLNNKTISADDIKLFIGYCGWDYNELEEEITEGSWSVADPAMEIIFSHHPEMLWEQLYEEI